MTRCYGCMRLKESSPHCEHCGFDEQHQNKKHQLPVGTVVGDQYVLGRVLGQGGFGITYLGWDRITEQTVAVKEYFPNGYAGRDPHDFTVTSYDDLERDSFERNKQRFLREAEALAKLWNIPQIVKVLRCFEENGTAYIAMEYVEGMDLRQYLKRLGRAMTAGETLAILGPVIEALDQVHRANLVHRDISPDNIMVLPDGSAKLLDFGAARYVENADAERVRNSSTQAILKHGFAPPEQYSSHGSLGPWTDVYALCGTVYFCLTGKVPPEAMDRSYEGALIYWDRIPDLTISQRAALEKGMALHPKERFSRVDDLWQQLKPKAPNLPKPAAKKKPKECTRSPEAGPTQKACPQEATPHKAKAKKGWLAAVAVVLALLIGAVALFGSEEGSKSLFPEGTTATPLEIQTVLDLHGVDLGHTATIPIVSGHNAANIRWTSSDPRIVSVSEAGIITAQGFGTAEITARFYEQEAVCRVSVELNPNISCTFEENETGWTITGIAKETGDLPAHTVLPRSHEGKPVTAIGYQAFAGSADLISVAIPDSITAIEVAAFQKCTGLTDVVIPEGVTSIQAHAFSGCTSLSNINIPSGVTSIEGYVFNDCSGLAALTIPEGIQAIGDQAFYRCSGLTGIVIPGSVTTIGSEAFMGCSSLADITIPDSVISVGSNAFRHTPWFTSNTDDFIICGDGVLIKYNGFNSHVVVPSGVKRIDAAFSYNRSIQHVEIPEGVLSIGADAFNGCTKLSSVSIPDSVESIGGSAFRDCYKLENVTIPGSVTTIGRFAFYGCSWLRISSIPDSVVSIGSEAFQHTSMTTVTIPWKCEISDDTFPKNCTVYRR